MFFKARKKTPAWPNPSFDDIKKRARLLVIDDDTFAYLDLFKRDGYAIEQWPDVEELTKLENGAFDIILLDVQGVGKMISPSEQGLGVLNHLRKVSPTQVVIAFSNSDFSLKYQDFFSLADAALAKSADYVDFKRKVDELLRDRFSLGFYVTRIITVAGDQIGDQAKLKKEVETAIAKRSPGKLRQFLKDKIATKENLELIVNIAKVAVEVADKWQK